MTLNFSSCSVFPTSIISDDDITWPMRHRSSEGFTAPYWPSWDITDGYDHSGEANRDHSYDPIDLLPSDPFGMELSTSLTAAVTGWIGDFGANQASYEFGGDDFVVGLNYYWNSVLASSSSECWIEEPWGSSECWIEEPWGSSSYEAPAVFSSVSDIGDFPSSSGSQAAVFNGDGGIPHEGLLFALGKLGIHDLLSVEMVCRSLRFTVQSDTLLWRHIHIDSPLSDRITDDDLLRLTRRSQGSLLCLSMVGCSRITDDGLKRVFECNPRLKKLAIPGCVRLSIEGLISNLKALKPTGMPGIEQLKVGRLFSVPQELFEELKLLVGEGELQDPMTLKPRFFRRGIYSVKACDDEQTIDIEMCPKCQIFKLLYDCPFEGCVVKGRESCRACEICIPRCFECGRCINIYMFTETFCLENLCEDCCRAERLER